MTDELTPERLARLRKEWQQRQDDLTPWPQIQPSAVLALLDRIDELEGALRPFAEAFDRHEYGRGVSARDWRRAHQALRHPGSEAARSARARPVGGDSNGGRVLALPRPRVLQRRQVPRLWRDRQTAV